MRILTVCASLGRGGTQRAAQSFSLAYRRAGHEVAFLAHAEGGPRQRRLEAAGIPVFLGGDDLPKALSAADQFDPDVIHIHRAGVRNDKETHILQVLRRPDRRVLETNVFGRVDYSKGADLIDVHFQLSSWCMWRWRRTLGSQRRCRAGIVLPYPIDPSDFCPASHEQTEAFRREHHIPLDAFLCGRVGQPALAKWHAQNLLAFAKIGTLDPNAWMVLLGIPDALRAMRNSLPASVRNRIVILPETNSDSELGTLYSSLDCFVHASLIGESFGLVLAEAMACNCPVVTASRPHRDNSQVEVVGHQEGGLVAGSVRNLPEAAIELWSSPAQRRKIRRQARSRVLARFALETVSAKALKAAAIALAHGDRHKLMDALGEDPDFQTDTSDAEIDRLVHHVHGQPARSEILMMHLCIHPTVQRLIRKYRELRASPRACRPITQAKTESIVHDRAPSSCVGN